MRNVLDKVAARINTHFLCCSVTFFRNVPFMR